MSDHIWRQGFGICPMREWMRRKLPGSSVGTNSGLVLVDLDLAVRRYGPQYGLDGVGDLLLIEKKEYTGKMTWGEKYIYGWLDRAIKNSTSSPKWRGFYELRVQYNSTPDICECCGQPTENSDGAFERFRNAKLFLDGKEISHDELQQFIEGIQQE